jgi:hypothetical protein
MPAISSQLPSISYTDTCHQLHSSLISAAQLPAISYTAPLHQLHSSLPSATQLFHLLLSSLISHIQLPAVSYKASCHQLHSSIAVSYTGPCHQQHRYFSRQHLLLGFNHATSCTMQLHSPVVSYEHTILLNTSLQSAIQLNDTARFSHIVPCICYKTSCPCSCLTRLHTCSFFSQQSQLDRSLTAVSFTAPCLSYTAHVPVRQILTSATQLLISATLLLSLLHSSFSPLHSSLSLSNSFLSPLHSFLSLQQNFLSVHTSYVRYTAAYLCNTASYITNIIAFPQGIAIVRITSKEA